MTKSPQESIIAILIARLGGDVRITPKEFYDADNLELTRIEDPASRDMRFTSKLPPVELVGELVEDEAAALPQANLAPHIKHLQALAAENPDYDKDWAL